MVQQLESAERAHDSRRCWECARALAGTGVQARKRWRGSCRGECPLAAEWERHLSSDGPHGGQSVYTLWTGDADAIKTVLSIGQQLYEPPCANLQAQEQRHLEGTDATYDNDLNGALDAGCEDAEDKYTEINRRHQGYAVPPWSMNRAVWRFLLTGPP